MVKIDSWALPTNKDGQPQIETQSTNNFTTNNTNWLSNETLTNNSFFPTRLDVGKLDGDEKNNSITKIHFHGKCNMTDAEDVFHIVYTNGVNDFLGESFRPTINPIDSMYHFSFILNATTRYVKLGNVSPSGNNITNFTINYTFWKT